MSGFLAFWLSGLVFLFCCGEMKADSSVEICPLAKAESHCDKANAETKSNFFGKSENANFDCCGFLPKVFDKVRKLEKFQETAQVSDKLKIDKPRFFIVESDFRISETYHPPSFASNKTFIKNCVFRI